MRVVIFCHSIISDWNHGNAHFLRGVASELLARGHEVQIYEPRDAWSLQNLVADCGEGSVARFRAAFPHFAISRYVPQALDLDAALADASLVLVHEWSSHELVAGIGTHRRRSGRYRLLFHDTHHRSVSDPGAMRAYDLSGYDGVLAFGAVIRQLYEREGWARRAWTWHEAADTRVFRPMAGERAGHLVWIGNWGDEERTAEISEFFLEPARELRLAARVYGVRYPEPAQRALADAGVEYAGWVANYEVPQVFSRFRATIHVPRAPYVKLLPGIPTIRVFEALACGIPLISAPWNDAEALFRPGRDFLFARDGAEMKRHLQTLLAEPEAAAELARHGRETILARHTCAHRVDELLNIYQCLNN